MKQKIVLSVLIVLVGIGIITWTSQLLNKPSWAYFFSGAILVLLEITLIGTLLYNINKKK